MTDYNDELYSYLKMNDIDPDDAAKIFNTTTLKLTEKLFFDDSLTKKQYDKAINKLHANGY